MSQNMFTLADGHLAEQVTLTW